MKIEAPAPQPRRTMDTTPKHHQSSRSTIQTHTLQRAASIQFPMHRSRGDDLPSFPSPSTVSHSEVAGGIRRSATGVDFQTPRNEVVDAQGRYAGYSNSKTREAFSCPLPRSYINDSKDTEVLFLHSYCKIISFTTTPTVSLNPIQKLLPFSNSTDRTMSSGPLKIYRTKPHNIAFIQSGEIIHPVMAKSQCWCVEEVVGRGIWGRGRGRGVFILRIRPGVYWRVEVKEGGITGLVDELKNLLRSILAFEREECPFVRVGVTLVGDTGNGDIEQKTGVNKKVQPLSVGDSSSLLKPRMISPYCERLNPTKCFTRKHPPYTPSSSANTPPVLESFDEILSRPTPPVQNDNSLSMLGNVGHAIALEAGTPGEIWESTRTLASLSTKSSCDSLALSLSTWSDSASTSLASSPPMCSSLVKAPLPSRGSSLQSRTYAQPWTISPPTCSTVTQTTTTQTLFTTSYTDESTTYLQGVVSQPSSLLHTAADIAIFKPSAYVVNAVLRIARSVIGGASVGKIERVQIHGGDTDGGYKVECA